MSEYVEYNEIPLQTIKQRRKTEILINDLEKKLQENGNRF